MLKEILLSILIATPLGWAAVIGLIWIVWRVIKEVNMWRLAWEAAQDPDEDELDAEWEEVVYK